MMMMPAARSKSRLSGILTIEFAGSAIFSRAPLWPQDATTRSPTFRSVTPAPTLSITPATSAAGENGNGGLIWYLPWIISRSKKFSAADLMAITAWPASATGSGRSASTRSSGPQYCEQRMAFMDTPDFRTHKDRWVLHAGFEAGLQSDSGWRGGRLASGARIARTRNLEITGSTIYGFRIRRHAPVRNDGRTTKRGSTDV